MKIGTTKNIWITSDTHYSHKNLCRGTTEWRTPSGEIPMGSTRDFPTIEKMNDTIVDNINLCVGQDDILIHAGDWSFSGFENIIKFYERIICKNIHLVLGNHDHHIQKNKNDVQKLFLSVSTRLVFSIEKTLIIVDHFPILSWEDLKNGSIMLHGHTHLPNDKKFGNGRIMDIGLDGNINFQPYNLHKECFVPLLKRPIRSGLYDDHHLDKIQNQGK
jgi:calcineurin-like phosphoesterase family protein